MTNEEYNALLVVLNMIKNETQHGANTANRVGSALISIANYLRSTDQKVPSGTFLKDATVAARVLTVTKNDGSKVVYNDCLSVCGLMLWHGTQAQYDAISPHRDDVVYIIK